jgi:hypothetical protein
MNTIVANVLMREAARAETGGPGSLAVVVLFCGLGMLAALCALSLGFDVSGGGF